MAQGNNTGMGQGYSGGAAQSIPSISWSVKDMAVEIVAGDVILKGNLTTPVGAQSIIIFAHGSGSGRHSPRNRYAAEILNEHRFATLLVDLLTEEEEIADQQTGHLRFNIPMLSTRLILIAEWLERDPDLGPLQLGCFGASTGAGAALIAAARHPRHVMAVVSRGGRPDLAGEFLSQVKAPTLLIVGENDQDVLYLNRQALLNLNKDSRLEVVRDATHLFEEPGTLEAAVKLAADWFEKHEGIK